MSKSWYASVARRKNHLIDLRFTNTPQTSKWKVLGHKTLAGAFASPQTLFVVNKGTHYLSPTVDASVSLLMPDASRKGQTMAAFDLDDFNDGVLGNPLIPHDDQFFFMRIQEFDVALNTYKASGPIQIVHNADFFGMQTPTFAVSGSTPIVTVAEGSQPPDDNTFLRMFVPNLTRQFELANNGTQSILFSFGMGQPLSLLKANESISVSSGMIDELIIGSLVGATTFRAFFTIGHIQS